MQHFYATLLRERFVIIPENKKNEQQTAIGNRIDFRCFDKHGSKEGYFIVRAQNIHTALRIAAQVARHWYEYGHLNKTGQNRFSWKDVYKDATMDFEKRWNDKCWASLYKNGKLFDSEEGQERSIILDLIEQVQAYEGSDYKHIAIMAEKNFAKAGRKAKVEYDSNLALDLHGSPYSVQTNIVYRDNEGRNPMALHIKQKEMQYVPGAKGQYIKLSECLSLAALVFEGYQLGFVIGRTQYKLSKGEIGLGSREAVHADHAIRRLQRLSTALMEMKKKYQLSFEPGPDFQSHVKDVEDSFHKGKHK